DLALHVGELVRSLGGVTRLSGPIRKTYRSQDGEKLTGRPAWFVSLALPPEIVPFRNQAKAERWRPTGHCNRTRTLNRFVAAVEPDGEADCVCIEVADSSGLYVTRDHIVTHNSAACAWALIWFM